LFYKSLLAIMMSKPLNKQSCIQGVVLFLFPFDSHFFENSSGYSSVLLLHPPRLPFTLEHFTLKKCSYPRALARAKKDATYRALLSAYDQKINLLRAMRHFFFCLRKNRIGINRYFFTLVYTTILVSKNSSSK
jgi:hypothetical protein